MKVMPVKYTAGLLLKRTLKNVADEFLNPFDIYAIAVDADGPHINVATFSMRLMRCIPPIGLSNIEGATVYEADVIILQDPFRVGVC